MRMRERIVAMYAEGKSTEQTAAAMGTGRPGTRRVRQYLRERGTLEPRAGKTGHAGGLTPEVERRLRDRVGAEPGATRQTLRGRPGVTADVRTVGRWLAKAGLALEKSRPAPPGRTAPT